MTESIGFLGLGLLGLPMATNLVAAGHAVRAFNRTASKADSLIARGATRAATPIDAIVPGGIVVTALWDGTAVEAVVATAGFFERLGHGGLHISTSTILPETSKRLAALHHAHGCGFVEAPIFGRPEAAVAKQLWVPYCGAAADKARAKPILEAMGAQGLFDFGEAFGGALVCKLVGNFMIGAAARSMVEGAEVARQAGADAALVLDMLTSTLFAAPIYKAYAKRVAETSDIFTGSKIPAKDLGLLLEAAKPAGTPTPIAQLMLQLAEK